MERKVGEVFDFNGVKLQVKDTGDSCTCYGCYFSVHKRKRNGVRFRNQTGECFQFYRSDGKNVIFVKVEGDDL